MAPPRRGSSATSPTSSLTGSVRQQHLAPIQRAPRRTPNRVPRSGLVVRARGSAADRMLADRSASVPGSDRCPRSERRPADGPCRAWPARACGTAGLPGAGRSPRRGEDLRPAINTSHVTKSCHVGGRTLRVILHLLSRVECLCRCRGSPAACRRIGPCCRGSAERVDRRAPGWPPVPGAAVWVVSASGSAMPARHRWTTGPMRRGPAGRTGGQTGPGRCPVRRRRCR